MTVGNLKDLLLQFDIKVKLVTTHDTSNPQSILVSREELLSLLDPIKSWKVIDTHFENSILCVCINFIFLD